MLTFGSTLAIFSTFAPVVFFTILFSRRSSKYLMVDKVIIVLVSISLITDFFSKYFVEGTNYIYLFIYMIVETFLLLHFYQILFYKRRALILLMLSIFLSSLIYELSFINPFYEFYTITLTIRCLIFIILSLFYFYQIYTAEEDIFKKKAADFWYNVGILIYFSLAFFPFFLVTEIMKGWTEYPIWYVHNIGNILKNIIFAVGLWMVQKR